MTPFRSALFWTLVVFVAVSVMFLI